MLLQEVILETFAILKQKCTGYRIIPGDVLGYFVAIMLKMDDTEFLNKSIIPFPFSRMDRGLLTVRVWFVMISFQVGPIDFFRSVFV